MPAVNWRICTVCVLHLTFSPSRYLELYHIKLLASLWLMFYTHLQVLIESWSISGRWAVQGFAMCLFKEGNLRVRGRGGVPSVLSFSFSHSTSPGCLFCIPWHFVKGTERSSLVNPTKKKKNWVLKYTFKDGGELLDLFNSFGRSHSGDSLAVLENPIVYF